MRVFGLTGGIGMGKSTCAELLRRRSIRVVDTDDLARDLVQTGQPAFEEIVSTFGLKILDASGKLDRASLARIVFADDRALRKLEAILHPKIVTAWTARLERWRAEDVPAAAVVIPLLFETAAQSQFDVTVCLACTPVTQLARLKLRGWTVEEIARRSAAQMPIEQKLACSDFVIWTQGSLEAHAGQIEKIFKPG